MASAQIIGGNFEANSFLWDVGQDVRVGALRGVGGQSLSGRVASVEVVTEEVGKSFLKSAAVGIAGAVTLGGVGALAGVAAGGNTRQVLFLVKLQSGRQFLAKGDGKIFELLLAASLAPRSTPVSLGSARIVSGDLRGQIRQKKGAFQVFGSPGQQPITLNNRLRELEVLERSGAQTRFRCVLKSGEIFEAVGDQKLFDGLEKVFKASKNGIWGIGCLFLVLAFLAVCFRML